MADNLGNSINNLNDRLDEGKAKFRDLRAEAEALASEVGKSASASRKAGDAYSGLSSILEKLQGQQEGINRLSDSQLDKLQEQARIKRLQLENSLSLNTKLDKTVRLEDVRAKTGKKILDLHGGAFENALRTAAESGKITEEEMALLRAKKNSFDAEERMLGAIDEEVNKRKQVNASLGIAGGLLKGFNSIAGEFGKAFNLDKVQEDMEEFADKTIEAEGSVSRLAVLGKGLQSAFSNLGKTLTDPAVIFTTLYKSATQVSQEVTNLQRATGMSYGNATALNAELRMTAQTSGQIQISATKLHEAFAAITSELGVSADILGGEALISMSNLTKKIGLGTKEATQLTLMSRLQGKNTEETLSSTVGVVNNLNKQNKTAINFKGVLSDVANSSKTLQVSLGANPEALAEAAFEAKKLGLSLGALESIADNLLNFESSIQAEMEAELLTGKQINLEKAREAALNNDMVGLSKEIANNQEIASAFASGNRLEQQAIAKAMGMSKDQLADMYYQQELNKLSAEEFKERYGEAAYEQAKALSASEKFGYTLDRVKEIIGNIGMALAPVLDLVAGILSKWYILYPLMGLVALSYVPKLAKGAKDFAGNIKSGFDSIKGIAKGVKDVATGKGSGALKEAVIGKSDIDPVKKSGDQMKPGGGKGIKENLSGLGDGLKKMAGGQVTQGILNLALAGPSLLLSLPSIPFLLFMGLTPLNQLETNFTSLGNGLKKMGGGPVFAGIGALALAGPALAIANLAIPFLTFMALPLGPLIQSGLTGLANGLSSLGNNFASVAKGALVLTILSVSLIPAAFAFSLLAGVDVGSMIAFSIALPLLALAAAGLGFLAPFIIFGSVALAALGTALIPAAEAFGNLARVDVGSISAFSAGIYDLAYSVAGLGFLAPAIAFGGIALEALGASLEVLSVGFSALESVDTEALISGLTGLASLGPGLTETATALFAVAGGMGAFALTGFLALPVIGALTALGAVSEGLSSIFGGGGEEKSDEGSMKAIEQKLDQLIAVVSKGGDVYIDGSKVGKTLQLASSKMG